MKPRSPLWLLVVALFPLSHAAQTCKCLSYQPCWPNASEFEKLSSQLSQPLIRPIPPASACHPPSHPSGNCTEAVSHLDDGVWRSNIPGAMQAINFESFTFENGTIDACYYNFTLGFPCNQGNIPIIGVDARTVQDVQAAVRFSAKHNLKLVIKNTGHDFLGRSTARGALMLWTHNLKNISYNDHFVPEGGSYSTRSYKALTVEAGVQWFEAYAAANNSGRVIVGGLSAGGSVGAAGGWVLGGGHSALSPSYGLGVDNAIQFTVVLASGDYVTANEYKNTDLFWALRGGGGGTYGVVVTVAYQTHDLLPSTVIGFSVNFTTPEIAQNVTTDYFSTLVALSDVGLGGYSLLSPSNMLAFNFGTNISIAKANETIASFTDRVNSTVSSPYDFGVFVLSFPSFYDAFLAIYNRTGAGQVGGTGELISRLVSRKAVQEEPEKVAKVVLGVSDGIEFNFVAGGAVSQVDPESTGLNPAWRESVGMIAASITWDEGTSTAEIDHLRQGAAATLETFDPISPGSGTYLNEASLYEKDFKKSFFGSHYSHLKTIKHKYDKDDMFLVAEGVGSDDWDKLLNCRLQ